MRRYWIVTGMVLLALGCALNASTINGVANQIISAWTQHAVVLGGGTGDPTVAAPGTAAYPLVSNGSSSDPSFQVLPNAGLQNSSLTFASAGCITASGAVSLGATFTLTNTCTGFAGVTNAAAGATPTWVLQSGDATWTLSAAATAVVTVVTADKFVPHTIQVCQGSTPYTLAWPSNVKGGMTIGATANKCSVQGFESYDGVNIYATNTGLIAQ